MKKTFPPDAAPTPEPGGAEGRRLPVDAPCRNCGNPAEGNYCPQCGQRKVGVRVSIRHMLRDVLEDQFVLNPALPRTLTALLFHPGRLTNEYIRGRMVSYIPPFRLYLVASVLFFLVISFISLRALDRASMGSNPEAGDVDSLRVELLERQAELDGLDTLRLGPAPRSLVRQAIASNAAALALLADTSSPIDRTAYNDVRRLARGEGAVALAGRQPWAQEFTFTSDIEFLNRAMRRKVAEVGHLPPREALRAVVADVLGYAPHAMFVLLPLFALLLKLLYVRRNRYYAEHFVFALHVHAFFFVMFVLMAVLPWGVVDLVALLWMLVYMWLAMRRVYGQGWMRTTAKWAMLGWAYMLFVVLAMSTVSIVALLA